ncbi:MAG: sensor histidine kinase [Bacteroidia bacterium]
MEGRHRLYWICQLSGWLFYVLINVIFFGLSGNNKTKDYIPYIIIVPTGILLTHAYRFIIYKINALNKNLYIQVITMLIGSIVKAFILFATLYIASKFLQLSSNNYTLLTVISTIINFSVVFFIWNTIYFGYHYFANYKNAEINNLRLEASRKESELKSLKSQLNPHFMFNSMNSIRALIDENPLKAKEAVTKLSNILRNSLLMNKNKEIFLSEEIELVKDYLDLEKIRYEERLDFVINIDPNSKSVMLPPLIIQSQVENAIKHGISKNPDGGLIKITSIVKDGILNIKIENTGLLNEEKSQTGLGFTNSLQRLQLQYGRAADIKIYELKNDFKVITEINIPLN